MAGIFLLDRDFRPANEMMRKLFAQYLDKPTSGAEEVVRALHIWLVLVDYDDNE